MRGRLCGAIKDNIKKDYLYLDSAIIHFQIIYDKEEHIFGEYYFAAACASELQQSKNSFLQ